MSVFQALSSGNTGHPANVGRSAAAGAPPSADETGGGPASGGSGEGPASEGPGGAPDPAEPSGRLVRAASVPPQAHRQTIATTARMVEEHAHAGANSKGQALAC